MAHFLFGTLMDVEVMARVLERPFAGAELAPARLDGWRRVRALNASYPLLLPDPYRSVDGVLFARPTARDLVRIRHFESEEYEPCPVTVRTADGRSHAAAVFVALAEVFETDGAAWCLDSWRREHKTAFLRRCDRWMAECPELAES